MLIWDFSWSGFCLGAFKNLPPWSDDKVSRSWLARLEDGNILFAELAFAEADVASGPLVFKTPFK